MATRITAANRLTDRQRRALQLLAEHHHRGIAPPSLRELADHLGLTGANATRGASDLVLALEARQLLQPGRPGLVSPPTPRGLAALGLPDAQPQARAS